MPREQHQLKGLSEKWELRWLCFDGPLAEAVMFSYQYPRYIRNAGVPPKELFEKIQNNIYENDPHKVRLIGGYILELIALSGRTASGGEDNRQTILRCMDFMNDNLENPDLDLTMICDEVKVHRSTLTKLFQEKVGFPPGRYLLNIRFALAQTPLTNTGFSINQIALKCGFREQSSFSRLIRRGTGMSPIMFRKKMQQAEGKKSSEKTE